MKKSIIFLFVLIMINFSLLTKKSDAQWVQLQQIGIGDIRAMAVSGNNIFAGTSDAGVFRSTNNGTNWTHVPVDGWVSALAVQNNYIFAGTMTQVYISTNDGTSWTQTSLNQNAYSFAISGNNIFAGSYLGVYLSSDNGTNWTQTALNNQQVWALDTLGNNIFAGTGNGILLTTNNGANWTQTSLNDQDIRSFAIRGNNIFAGSQGPDFGVYVSTNNGTSWTHTPLYSNTGAMTSSGNNVFAGTANYPAGTGGIWLTTNNGANWTLKNEGFIITSYSSNVMSLLVTNNDIFAGTWGNSIWRRSLSDIITSTKISNNEIPENFKLEQNYPNPFNPSTNIIYNLAKSGFVKIVVFDALGREVQTLVNENKPAGVYKTTFNALSVQSGVYFYKLMIGDYSDVKKMVVIK
jgi:photosystem II stability/assembly factor-like uncharacterized protein